MAHDFSVFDRPDLNVRMVSRRRLPHRSASATPSTQNGIGLHPVTYSAFLGMFDDESTPMVNGNGIHLNGLSPGTENGFPFNPFDPLGQGPSRAHSSTYQGFQSPASVVESGWIKDVFGKDQWVGHGKIEEVVDDAAVSINLGDDESDILATPRAKSTARLSWASNNHHANGHEQDAIPLNSTPPPRPRPRKLPSLRETPSGSDYQSFKATSTNTHPAMAPPTHAGTSSSALDDPTEVALVKENLELLALCTEDVKIMETYFLVQPVELELSQHIDICSRLQESLRSLRDTLTHRAQMGAEEWHVRSSSWHQKYSKRLLSLRTTLQRLSRMREPIESQPLRPRQRLAIQTKLEQHEAKLADLASKYTVAFDRLRLRHLHFLLTQSHQKAKQQKAQKTRLMSRASFEREWKEGKMIRASLRHAFHDLRQEFYNNNSRSARHTYAP